MFTIFSCLYIISEIPVWENSRERTYIQNVSKLYDTLGTGGLLINEIL